MNKHQVKSGHARGHLKGFTLIELLVVIAIIGILSAVVLASLSTARTKGKDASVQESMSSMRAAAEIVYGGNGNKYGSSANCNGMPFSDTASNMAGLVTSVTANAGAAPACRSVDTAWVVAATLPSSSTQQFCVDSTGKAAVFNGTLAASYTYTAGTAAYCN
jgi:prepilin-type N-terminal cleavage/methylation domain-containing protein